MILRCIAAKPIAKYGEDYIFYDQRCDGATRLWHKAPSAGLSDRGPIVGSFITGRAGQSDLSKVHL